MVHPALIVVALAIAFVAIGCSAPVRRTLSPPFESHLPASTTAVGDASDITPEVTGIIDEPELCDLVMRDVRLRVDDVPAGVAIEITATSPARLEAARRQAKTLEQALEPVGEVVAHREPEGEGCGIVDLAENDLSVRLDLIPDGTRLELTTVDPRKIDALRSEAHAFVEKARTRDVTREQGPALP
jgi:hypothetical protein